jgi:hypothetical protein
MKDAVSVDVEDPGIFVKSFLELADIIVIEAVYVEPHNPKDFVLVICSRGHRDLLLFKTDIFHVGSPDHLIGTISVRRGVVQCASADRAISWRGDEGLLRVGPAACRWPDEGPESAPSCRYG